MHLLRINMQENKNGHVSRRAVRLCHSSLTCPLLSSLPLPSSSLLPHPRGVEPHDPPTTVLVQRHEPQGVSTVLSSTDFFQSEQNRRVILEQVDSFQLRDKYMFATTTRVREEFRNSWRKTNIYICVCVCGNSIYSLQSDIWHYIPVHVPIFTHKPTFWHFSGI